MLIPGPRFDRLAIDRLAPRSWGVRGAADLDAAALAPALGMAAHQIRSVEVLAVDHGTSQRSRVLVRHDNGQQTALFVKNSPIRLAAGVLNAAARLCEREARFYRDLAPLVASAPNAVLSCWDPRTGRSAVVLPDLTEHGFVFAEAAQASSVDEVGRALTALAELHATFSAPSAAAPAVHGPASDPVYTVNGPAMRRLGRVAGWAVGRGPRILVPLVPAPVLARSRILARAGDGYARMLASFPQAFIHNDTHRGNIALGGGRAVLIDWQYCGWGPAMKDVAYLMVTALEPADRRDSERDLIGHYLQRLQERGGRPLGQKEAWSAYRVLSTTGYLAAAFASLFSTSLQAVENCHQPLRRASAAMQDLDAFTALEQHLSRQGIGA